jgi:Amt family ammonium transporter
VKRTLKAVPAAVGLLALTALPAVAQEPTTTELAETIEGLAYDLNVVWVGLAAALVFLMQLGFAMVESGLTRAKNAANIVAKNLADMSIGAVFYWAIGASVAYGAGTFLGSGHLFDGAGALGGDGTQFVFQLVFAATAATIVSGAVAGRMKFSSYVVVSIAITALIYPIVTHWQWPLTDGVGAWLYESGYHDFAGSSLVHMTGGIAALVGAAILGPRLGKYGKDGKPRAIPGHNIPYAIFGVFVLWFGWFGFNGGSTLAAAGLGGDIGIILLSTNIAAGAGGLAAGLLTWILNKKPDPAMAGNGVLAGLVGITAGTNFATGAEALAIGALCGAVVVFAVKAFDAIRIDDPVGAISVHGVCGAIGTLAVGVIAAGESNGGYEISLATQALGVAAIAGFVAASSAVVFLGLKYTIGIRVSEEEEIEGLDINEHGLYGYPETILGPSLGSAPSGAGIRTAPAPTPLTRPATE